MKPTNSIKLAIQAHHNIHKARRKEEGWVVWWWKYIMDSNFRLREEGLAIAEEIKVHPPVMKKIVFLAERRNLTGRKYRWAAECFTSAECAILRNLSVEDFEWQED